MEINQYAMKKVHNIVLIIVADITMMTKEPTHYLQVKKHWWNRKSIEQKWYIGINLIVFIIDLIICNYVGIGVDSVKLMGITGSCAFVIKFPLLMKITKHFWNSLIVSIPLIGWMYALYLFFKDPNAIV